MRPSTAITWLAIAVVLGGCTSSQAIRDWQDSVETYIDEHGNGDPNVLRSVSDDPAAKDFGLVGAQNEGVPFVLPSRTDVTSAVLGHRRHNDRFWFIFMVGATRYRGAFSNFPLEDAQLRDLRPAALSVEGGTYLWRLGDRDTEAMDVYIEPQIERWRQSDTSREVASKPTTRFPSPADDWTINIDEAGVTITELHSGARWVLELGEE